MFFSEFFHSAYNRAKHRHSLNELQQKERRFLDAFLITPFLAAIFLPCRKSLVFKGVVCATYATSSLSLLAASEAFRRMHEERKQMMLTCAKRAADKCAAASAKGKE